MKAILFLVGLLALAFASQSSPKQDKYSFYGQNKYKADDKLSLLQQKDILRLFRFINQPNFYDDQVNFAKAFDLEASAASYSNPKVVQDYYPYYYQRGLLPKGEIFSAFNEKQLKEAIALYKLFYYAKDYDTFYKTACWARQYINEGIYIYALSVAIVRRPDTNSIVLPPIYEIYPYYFFNADIIQKAQKAKQLYYGYSQQYQGGQFPSQTYQEPEQLRQNKQYQPENDQDKYSYKQVAFQKVLYKQLTEEQFQQQQDPQQQYSKQPYPQQQYPQQQYPQQQYPQQQYSQQQYPQQQYSQQQYPQQQYPQQQYSPEEYQQKGYNGFTIDTNYSGSYYESSYNSDQEQSLSYFTEDIGLNAFYYYFNIYYPFWMSNDELYFRSDRRGEQYYYMYQQLLARYYLERLSNGLGDIPIFEYKTPIRSGYYSSLAYPNGVQFPDRPSNYFYQFYQPKGQRYPYYSNCSYSYYFVKDYERRIRDAIDLGYAYTLFGKKIYLYDPRGFEILGNIIEGNPESPNSRYYGTLQLYMRYLLGNSYYSSLQYKEAPSAIQQFETSLRDPAFYQLYKRIILYFQKYKSYLSSYSYSELYVPGVKIQDVQVDRLITYFDYFYTDLSNAVFVNKQEYESESVQIRARQPRLNHKPYTFTINVSSEKPIDAIVRIYLGPKYDEFGRSYDINENRLNFVELDRFLYSLKVGNNIIERNSRQSFYARDRSTYKELYMRVMAGYNNAEELQLDSSEASYGFPNRLLLPKGTRSGQTYQLYVMLSPYRTPTKKQSSQEGYDNRSKMYYGQYIDSYSLGYPFDRYIDESIFYVPNSFFKDVVIYNRNLEEINI